MAKFEVAICPKWYKLNYATFLICSFFVVGSATAAELTDHFDGPKLDTVVWNPCQADVVNLIGFGETTVGGSKKRFLINKIDETREDADCVSTGASGALLSGLSEKDVLGPSLVFPRTPAYFSAGLFFPPPPANEPDNQCVEAETRNGKPIIQRNELRFRNKQIHSHPLGDAHWYGLAFKMEGTIPTCGSVRWILAQWKYNDPQWPREFSQSPFLAQRFDNGVFHITVQNGRCRCMVAKAHGDPNNMIIAASVANFAASPTDAAKLKPVSPAICVLSGGGPRDGTPCEPNRFRMFALDASRVPVLPDPRRDWVKMMYHVKGGGEGDGRIDIYANNQFVVRVDGVIGYPGGTPGRVKFKFGHYRDKIAGEARMLVDEFCVSATASKCDKRLRPIK